MIPPGRHFNTALRKITKTIGRMKRAGHRHDGDMHQTRHGLMSWFAVMV